MTDSRTSTDEIINTASPMDGTLPVPGHTVENGSGASPDGDVLSAITAERDDLRDQLQRVAADFANFRRRSDEERAMVRLDSNRMLLLQVLEVLDDFQRALGAIPEEHRDSGWVAGVAMIEKKFQTLLERAGVTPVDTLGQPFDPALHEAVATQPGSSDQVVAEVYRTGYRLGDRLLRPAMVKVGDLPSDTNPESQ